MDSSDNTDSAPSWLESFGSTIGNLFNKAITPVISGLEKVGDFILDVFDAIKNGFVSIGDWFVLFKNLFTEWFASIPDFLSGFWDKLVGLFVIEEGYFKAKNDELYAAIDGRLKVDQYLNIFATLQNLTAATPKNLTAELWGVEYTIIDWKYFGNYQQEIYFWVRGFIYPLLLLYHYNQLYRLVRGSSYISAGKSGGDDE